MEIPEKMKSLPVDPRGIIIPFFVPIVSGVPNFKFADGEKIKECALNKRCGICGKPLIKNHYYFIGGPFTLLNKKSTDAPMHHDCAQYSLEICPHMYYQKAIRKTDEVQDKARDIMAPKPPILYLMRATNFNWANFQGHRLFDFTLHKHAERYVYEDNKLTSQGICNVMDELEANKPYIKDYIAKHS